MDDANAIDLHVKLIYQLDFRPGPVAWKPQHNPRDPTPEQIAARCAEIQSTWDTKTERLRRTGRTELLPLEVVECDGMIGETFGLNRDMDRQLYSGGIPGVDGGFGLRRGEDSPTAVLTESDVYEIRAASGTNISLGKKYGCAPATIFNIRNRITWRHLPDTESE